ncbi:putative HTH-type transcriptional regulator YtcD [Streptomyces sp. enrichment culture]|uniref:winged helix-turn-helix transcriptional regulator n=1 Tax=Streptomyces sp. enrichment culture TaxID=1795815 RepID=UPI003F55F4C8
MNANRPPGTRGPESGPCPITPVIDLVFGRWTTPVLWVLNHHGKLRFTELQKLLPDCTPKVLTQRLRQMERDGLVTRSYFAEMPPRVEYESTELARTLIPVFNALAEWSAQHMEKVLAARRANQDT